MTTYTKTINSNGIITAKQSIGSEVVKIFVKDETTNAWHYIRGAEDFWATKTLDDMSQFNFNFNAIDSILRNIVKRRAKVLVYLKDHMFLKGRIRKISYVSNYLAKVEGMGMEQDLMSKELYDATYQLDNDPTRVEYTSVDSNTIAKRLLSLNSDGSSPWIIQPLNTGTIATYGNLTIRFERYNRLNSVRDLSDAIDQDWWVSHSADYETDYFNIADKGTASGYTFKYNGANANCNITSKQSDEDGIMNYITCYDDKTEVLTKEGFKLFKDISSDDLIATLNPDNFNLEYHKSIAKQEYDYNGYMCKFTSPSYDLLVTPDHRMFVKTIGNDSRWQIMPAWKALCTNVKLKKNANWVGDTTDKIIIDNVNRLTVDKNTFDTTVFCRFLGWYISEGSLTKNIKKGYKISIPQKDKQYLNEIKNIVQCLGFKPFVCNHSNGCKSIEFNSKNLHTYLKKLGKSYDKYIPEDIKDLDKAYLIALVDTLFKGDGHINDKGRIEAYYTRSKKLADDVVEVLLKTGLCGSLKKRKNSPEYIVSVNNTHLEMLHRRKNSNIEYYNGKIYDLTVQNHILYVRRNGKCLWSGNCIGYSDGVNQLKTVVYNMSSTFTNLNEELTSSDTTITLTDASSFPSSGTIRIMQEQITYSGKSGNDLTGCTRGANALSHKTGCFVEVHTAWTTQETLQNNSDAGSSIGTYGICSHTEVYKNMRDRETLELLASYFLTVHKDDFERIEVEASYIYNTLSNVNLGDTATLVDSTTGANSTYNIVSFELSGEYGSYKLKVGLSHKSLELMNQLERLLKQSEDANQFMQGATNLWGDTQSSNANATTPLILQFYVPDNIQDADGNSRINQVKLSYSTKDYKTYSGSLTGSTGDAYTDAGMTNASSVTNAGMTNASSVTNAGMTNASSATNASMSNANAGAADTGYFLGNYSTTLNGDGNWHSVGTGVSTSAVNYFFHGINGSLRIGIDTAFAFIMQIYVRAYNSTDGTYYPSSAGIFLGDIFDEGTYTLIMPFYIHIPYNWTSKTYYLQYIADDDGEWTGVCEANYSYHGTRGHTHSNTFNDANHTNINSFNDANHTNINSFNDANHTNINSFNDAEHTNPAGTLNADYDLDEATTTSTDTSIKIYNSANTLLWDSGARGEILETDIDISSYITTNDYYRIEIYPNNNAYIFGTVYLKGGIES